MSASSRRCLRGSASKPSAVSTVGRSRTHSRSSIRAVRGLPHFSAPTAYTSRRRSADYSASRMQKTQAGRLSSARFSISYNTARSNSSRRESRVLRTREAMNVATSASASPNSRYPSNSRPGRNRSGTCRASERFPTGWTSPAGCDRRAGSASPFLIDQEWILVKGPGLQPAPAHPRATMFPVQAQHPIVGVKRWPGATNAQGE
jgi:hypothetical protein